MSETTGGMVGVYIDGETKTGKGAASQAIAESLENKGLNVYYDVAGDFFRRYVALVRQELGLRETDALPIGEPLQHAAETVYEGRQAFERNESLGDLQRQSISESVSILGELAIAQRAGGEWWVMSTQRAVAAGADVIVLDGRNPRDRMHKQEAITGIKVPVVLDLFMTCEPGEAGRRELVKEGIDNPTADQLHAATEHVIGRRDRDRKRTELPFVAPTLSVLYVPGQSSVADTIKSSWHDHDGAELPVTITLDNTHIPKPDMLAAVTELADTAIRFKLDDSVPIK